MSRWSRGVRSRFRPSSDRSAKRWSPPAPRAARSSCSSCPLREPARESARVRTRVTASEPAAPVAPVALTGAARRTALCLVAALTVWAARPVPAVAADNLPFSRAEGPDRGLYVELAELVAARLGLRSEYAWFLSHYGRRAVRSTLLADRCDAYFGLPDDADFMGRSVIRTRPFLEVGYAVIGPRPLA